MWKLLLLLLRAMSCCYCCHSSPNTHYEKQGHWQSRKNERQVPKMVGIELFCWFSSLYISVAVALLSTTTENATKTFRYKIFSSDKYFVQNSILLYNTVYFCIDCAIYENQLPLQNGTFSSSHFIFAVQWNQNLSHGTRTKLRLFFELLKMHNIFAGGNRCSFRVTFMKFQASRIHARLLCELQKISLHLESLSYKESFWKNGVVVRKQSILFIQMHRISFLNA